MRRVILLDTSALFASLDRRDPNYFQARVFLRKQRVIYLVPDTVFNEAMTLIKVRLGSELARSTGEQILAGAPIRLYRLTPEDANETWRIFCRYTDKDWSYTDCSILALSRRLDIQEVFAFDHHFDQMAPLGLLRLPTDERIGE